MLHVTAVIFKLYYWQLIIGREYHKISVIKSVCIQILCNLHMIFEMYNAVDTF